MLPKLLPLFLVAIGTYSTLPATSLPADPAPSMATLRAGFAQPEAPFRAKPLNQRKYPDGTSLMKDLKAGRWGGMNAVYPQGFSYLKDEAGWLRYGSYLQAVREQGMTAWIYDEDGYPSGKAGRQVLEGRPDLEAQGLFVATQFVKSGVTGGKASAETVWKLPPGKPFYVVAFPLAQNAIDFEGTPLDLTAMARDGELRTTLPATRWGGWRLMAFVQNRLYVGTHAVPTGAPYPNMLDPEAVRRFLDITHERYYARFAEYFGKTITASFTDEVSLMTGFLSDTDQPHPAIAWYHGLPDLFKKRTGRDIRECLPALVDDTVPEAAWWRCAFYDMLGQQIADAYYQQVRDWCARHGIASAGHLLWEESLIYHAHFYGNAFPSLKALDWPGIDVLWCKYGQAAGSHTDGGAVTPKLASSVSALYGRPYTMSEAFWDTRRQQTPIEEVMEHYSWQAAMGINTLTTITVQDEYPAEELGRFNDLVGRLNRVLGDGRPVAEVGILYPMASVQAHFKPTNRHVHFVDDNPKAADVDRAWRRVTELTLSAQRDFFYLDEDTLEGAKVENGELVFGNQRFRVLVLPHVTTLRLGSLRQLKRFVDAGGTLVSYATVPSVRADGADRAEFATLVDALWGQASKTVRHTVTEAAFTRAIQTSGTPDLRVSPSTPAINYQRRSLPQAEVYYVINNDTRPFKGTFTFEAKGKAEVWNPFDGTTTAVKAKRTSQGAAVELTLPARRGLFVVFARE